jgi:hypothetical protein
MSKKAIEHFNQMDLFNKVRIDDIEIEPLAYIAEHNAREGALLTIESDYAEANDLIERLEGKYDESKYELEPENYYTITVWDKLR